MGYRISAITANSLVAHSDLWPKIVTLAQVFLAASAVTSDAWRRRAHLRRTKYNVIPAHTTIPTMLS